MVLERDDHIASVVENVECGVAPLDDAGLADELRKAHAAAEVAEVARIEYRSSLGHDLRTPVNVILGFAQLLQEDRQEPLSDRHKDRVARILKAGEQLLRLIEDVVDVPRTKAGAVSAATNLDRL